MIHFNPEISHDNPHMGIVMTIICALTTVTTASLGFLQNVDLITGLVLKVIGICAGLSTIWAAYWTIKASKIKIKNGGD